MPFNDFYLGDDELFGSYNDPSEPEVEAPGMEYEDDSIFQNARYDEEAGGYTGSLYTEEPEYLSDDEIFETFDLGPGVQETRDEGQRLIDETAKNPIQMVADAAADTFFSTVEAAHDAVSLIDRFGTNFAKKIFRSQDSYEEQVQKLMEKYPDKDEEEIREAMDSAFEQKFNENAEAALGPAHGIVTENKEMQERLKDGGGWREAAEMGQPFGMSDYAKQNPETLQYYMEGSSAAVAQVGKMIALNMAMPGLGLAEIGAVAGTQQQKEAERRLVERGIDPNDAYFTSAAEGMISAGVESVLSHLPAERMMKVPAVRSKIMGAVLETLKVGSLEAVEEVSSELAQMAMREWIEKDPDAYENWRKQVKDAAIFGAVGGAVGGAPTAIAGGMQAGERRRQDANERADQVISLMQTGEGRAALEELSKIEKPSRKDFEKAGITARTSGKDRRQLAKTLPGILEDFDSDMQVAAERAAGQEFERDEEARAVKSMELEQEKRGLTESIKGAFRTDTDLGKAVTEVTTSLLTPEEVSKLQIEKGEKGEQEPGALYQIPEAVKAAVEDPAHKPTTDEDKFFGEIWPKAIKKARSLKGAFKGALTLSKEARTKWNERVSDHASKVAAWEAGGKKGQKPTLLDPFKSGSKFEKEINMPGIRKGVKEAVKDLLPFVEGKTEFQEYYRTEVEKEREAISQKHPELAKDDSAFQFYRLLNGVASAQTELFKNTQETERAYAGYKSTGRLPVVVAKDSKGKDRPQYALPKDNEFGATLPGEVDNIADALTEMDSQIPSDIREIFKGKERLTNADRKKLKSYAKNFKGRMNTTSDDLASNLWHEFIRSENPDAFKGKVRTAFEIAGGSSAYNKARNYHVVNYLLNKFDGDLDQLMPWLNERISVDELKKLNAEVGFSENIGGLSDIKDTVWVAEGQETAIPRTFIFGPKVGAYILNRIADAHPKNASYNTMDVWESRVWRSYAADLVDSDKGIAGGVPRRVYMRMAREFPKEFKKQTGMDISVSAGQAARWYFGMEMMRQAGYAKVGDKQTIAGYTMKLMEEYMAQELGGGNPDLAMLEQSLKEIEAAPNKAAKEAIAEKAPLFEGSRRTLGKEIPLPKKLSKKAQKEAEGEAAMAALEAEGRRAQVQKEAREVGPTVTQEIVTPQQPEITSITTLFQKSRGKILGLMRQDPNGKIIIKGFEGANAETALHEISHGARRLIWEAHAKGGEKASGLTNREIKLIENWAGKRKKGEEGWSERMEERFAAGMTHLITTGQAPNKHLKKPFQKLRAFIKRLFTQVKHPASDIKMRPEVRAAFEKLLSRRQRLQKQQKVKKLATSPKSWPQPYDRAWQAKRAYLKKMGMPERRQVSVVKVDQEFKQRLADAFDRMEHNPNDPEVKAAYDKLAEEVLEQWKAVEATGLHVEFNEQDYDTPSEVHKDLRDNNHLFAYPTSAGYGDGPIDVREEYAKTGNPMLKIVPDVEIDGREVTYNDLFRIVHDYFGHGLEGTSFGERGEENAWQAHVRMFSPLAARAMTAETRGQNSWVNVQPENKVKPGSVYAPQKTGLLPEWATTERVAPDARPQGQKADDAAEGAATTAKRGLKATADETAKADTRVQQEQAEQPRREAVTESGDSYSIAGKGGETVPQAFIDEEGKVTVYRYSKGDRGESYTIDPAKTTPSSYSRNDYQRAQTPRTFFYLNTSEKEGIVGNHLYSTKVDAKDIYNLITDPDGLKEQFKDGNTFDFDGIFAELKRRGKKGVYYNPGFHVVNMFEAVEAKRTDDIGRQVDREATQSIWSGVQKQLREGDAAGFTYNPRTREFPVTGYAVSPSKNSELVIDLGTTKSYEIPKIIQEYAGMMAARLAEQDMHLGGWVSDNKLYLDVSIVVPGENTARQIAKENNQLAIFNLGTQEEIDTSDPDSASSIVQNPREGGWNRDKGELTGPSISKLEAVRKILEIVGLRAGGNIADKPKQVQAYYRRAFAEIEGSPAPGVEINMQRKELANIGVAVHEVAHYFDDKLGLTDLGRYRTLAESFANNLTDSERRALTDESYEDPGNRQLKEGFAEALRIYVMNEHPETEFRSELAHTAFRRFLDDPRNKELNDFVTEARKVVEQYMRQPLADKVQRALANARGKIIDPGESYFARFARKKPVRAVMRYMAKKFGNRIADLEAAEKEVRRKYMEWWETLPDTERKGRTPEQAWDHLLRETGGLPSQMLLNAANSTSHLVDQAIFEKLQDFNGKKYGEAASDIFSEFSQKEIEEFGQYMYATVALQRYDASEVDPLTGRPTYVPGEVDIADLREFVRRTKSDKYDNAAKRTTAYFNNLLKMMVDHDLIQQHEYDSMTETHQLYMPFYRQFADSEHGLGGRFLGVQAPIKKLKGGSVMPVLDVYDAMIDRTHEVMGAINRRQVEQTFIDVFERSGISGMFLSRVTGPKSTAGPNVVTIVRDGKEVNYKVDPDIYNAMVMSGSPKLAKPVAAALAFFAVPTSIARKVLVNYSPFFPFRNFPRDMQTAAIKGLVDTTGIEGNLIPTSTMLGQALFQGGRLRNLSDLTKHETDIDKLYSDMGGDHNKRVTAAERITGGPVESMKKKLQKRRAFGKGIGPVNAVLDKFKAIEKLNEHLELAPRKAAFLATLQALSQTTDEFTVTADGKIEGTVPTWAKTRAMSNAMEVTVNFNRRGEWAPVLGKLFLFYNAAVQGSFTSRKQMVSDKKMATRAAVNLALNFTLKGLAFAMMAGMQSPEDEEKTMLDHYWEMPDYYKKLQDVILINVSGKKYGFSIPKERETAFVTRVFEKVWEHMLGSPTKSDDPFITQLADEMKEIAGESVPFTGGTLPTFVQFMVGQDWFRGQDIEGKWDDQKLDKNRYDSRTTTAAKFLSQGVGLHNLGLSPKEIDFLFRSAGAGTLVTTHEVFFDGKAGDKAPFMVNEASRQSSSDFYVKNQENKQKVNAWSDGEKYSDKEVEEILENERVYAIAESVRKAIRNSSLSDIDKERYTTGVSRWALGREAVADWPNPLVEYNTLPDDLRAEVAKAIKGLGRKPRLTEKTPEGVAKFKARAKASKAAVKRLTKAKGNQ